MSEKVLSPDAAKSREPAAAPAQSISPPALREMHFFLRLAREWDLRFERLARIGSVSKWYSSVGNEATTVAAATAIEAGDALVTLHRDSGAILRYYLDPSRIFPDLFPPIEGRKPVREDPRELLLRLACQMLGKAAGFSAGRERSYHYSFFHEEAGIFHAGMISHLGAMIPVAAGMALAFKQMKTDRVAINFIGEGGTSTGDFHEGLNMAAVLKVPFVLIIENNGYAFSTPSSEQYASGTLAERGASYGIPGVRVDGGDALAVLREVSAAVARARRGEGPTLIESVVGRMRGHSEGDDSFQLLPQDERKRNEEADPVLRFERMMLSRGAASREYFEELARKASDLVLEAVDRALASPDPDASSAGWSVHAG
jgi:2-oxoisovalerate dehydrogenase E1 component